MTRMRTRRWQLSALLFLLTFSDAVPSSAQTTPAPAAPPAPVARPERTPLPALAPPALDAPAAPAASMPPMAVPAAPRAPRAARAPRLSGGYLGVELVDLTPELREHFGTAREAGVMVGRVEPGSPAARAGLEVGDIVIRVGADPVHDSWGFSGEISSRESGNALSMTVVRGGRERQLEATLERRERTAVDVGRWIFPPTPAVPGLPPVAAAPGVPGVPPMPAMPPVGPALERLGRLLESDDFQEQIRAYQMGVDAAVEKRRPELAARLKDLERRLQDGDRRR